MKPLSDFKILPQPNETTCGPTCLQAVLRFFGDDLDLADVIAETPELEDGGTLAVLLGTQAIERGYQAKIFTYNLRVFDPSWFAHPSAIKVNQDHRVDCPDEKVPAVDLVKKLNDQIKHKESVKLQLACKAYSHFIEIGGEIRMHDLNKQLLRQYFSRSIPILTGLSSTYLYQAARERQRDMKPDDIRGTPTGHFVVLCGETPARKLIRVADPYIPNPFTKHHYYDVTRDRLICAILLGVLTYDANLLIIQPKSDP
jgi:hypothetical protein